MVDELRRRAERLGIFHRFLAETVPHHLHEGSVALGSGHCEVVLAPDIVIGPEVVFPDSTDKAGILHHCRHSPFGMEFTGRDREIRIRIHGTVRSVTGDTSLRGIRDVEDSGMEFSHGP